MNQESVLLSGVKPTGLPHIANYFGAMRQFVDLQDQYTSFIMIADLHALTSFQKPEDLRNNILNLAIDYLTIGIDPDKTILFRQSDVPAHTELAWIFNCITTMPYLMRAHAYKDAEAKNKDISVGTFTYPTLMAADILLYEPQVVPVGQDQKQHVEYARDIAEKFNHLFGDTFKLPEALILSDVKTIPGIDGRKMSKSYNNTIPLFADDETIRTQIMKIVTDSKNPEDPKDPDQDNVFALHKLFSSKQLPELRDRYQKGQIGYKESKEILIKNLIDFVTPLRERRQIYASDIDQVQNWLNIGGQKAQAKAQAKLQQVKGLMGL